jgi:hypothetical protein
MVLGDFNRDMLLLSEPSKEKSTQKVFRWFGGSILLADLIKQALEIPLESTDFELFPKDKKEKRIAFIVFVNLLPGLRGRVERRITI